MLTFRSIYNDYTYFLKKNIYILVFIFYSFFLVKNAIKLYRYFPTYSIWNELFNSYAGGFVRRGLIGEILYVFSGLGIDIRILVPIVVVIFNVLFVFFCIKFLRKKVDTVFALFISCSPGIFFFAFFDPGVLARKDGIVAASFILLFFISKKDTWIVRILILVISAVGMLIHEALWFYLTMPLILLYLSSRRENKTTSFYIFSGLLLFVSLMLILKFSGTQEQAKLIDESWHMMIPGYPDKKFSYYIGATLQDVNPWLSLKYFKLKSMIGIILGFILTLLPVFLWMKKNDLFARLNQEFSTKTEKLMLLCAVIFPCLLILLENDFGRRISLFSEELLFFMLFFCSSINLTTYKKYYISHIMIYAVILYSFTWNMYHYTAPGSSIVKFSPVFAVKFLLFSFFAYGFYNVARYIKSSHWYDMCITKITLHK
ncbi:hypothetical protein [uncultured Desulfovibrio sp.]|uniref:hypothetical protein n=2 Tax=uncultured Desulfovibrio sp. TaxID=167968 RepID=UPI002629748D|nr:hypothetical protein [uncultured Desulfovibrio sp.]